MKRIDLLKQKDNLWCEIEELKKHRTDARVNSNEMNKKINLLKKKYVFTKELLKANKQ